MLKTSPVLLSDSIEQPDPSKKSNGECPGLAGVLFLLSRTLLALQAMVKRNGWRGSAGHDEGAANYLLSICVTRIIEISKMPNTFPEITQELLDAFESLYDVKSHRSMVHEHGPNGLTGREVEIVQYLAEGKCNKEIAAALHITVKTVETHRTRIMLKLGTHSLSDVTRFAVRHGIITILLDQPS